MRIRFLDIWFTLDSNMPLWVNDGDTCERYESKYDTPDSYDLREVLYMTLDANKELTIELNEGVAR